MPFALSEALVVQVGTRVSRLELGRSRSRRGEGSARVVSGKTD
jgi:hypothetical protein